MGSVRFHQSEFGQHMIALNLQEEAEWHLDGDMVRGHADQFQIECTPGGLSKKTVLANRWKPRSNTAFARKMCADTGLHQMDVVQIFRYVAQRVVPLDSFDEAKRKCRSLWNGKVALAIHVRRTDKVAHEDRAYTVQEYVQAAQKNGWKFDIVHIVTDDPTGVGKEMKCDEVSLLQGDLDVKCTQLKHTKDDLKTVQTGGAFKGLLED